MPNCATCQIPLTKPADEYGPRHASLCLDCFLALPDNEPEEEINAIRAMLNRITQDIGMIDDDVYSRRTTLSHMEYSFELIDEIEEAERCRAALEVERNELRVRMFELIKQVKTNREIENARLVRLMEGVRI